MENNTKKRILLVVGAVVLGVAILDAIDGEILKAVRHVSMSGLFATIALSRQSTKVGRGMMVGLGTLYVVLTIVSWLKV